MLVRSGELSYKVDAEGIEHRVRGDYIKPGTETVLDDNEFVELPQHEEDQVPTLPMSNLQLVVQKTVSSRKSTCTKKQPYTFAEKFEN